MVDPPAAKAMASSNVARSPLPSALINKVSGPSEVAAGVIVGAVVSVAAAVSVAKGVSVGTAVLVAAGAAVGSLVSVGTAVGCSDAVVADGSVEGASERAVGWTTSLAALHAANRSEVSRIFSRSKWARWIVTVFTMNKRTPENLDETVIAVTKLFFVSS